MNVHRDEIGSAGAGQLNALRFSIPLGALCLMAAVLGFWMGSARPDENEAIARVAAHYQSEVPEAEALACAARPGEGRVWLVVGCGVPGSPERRVYTLDRAGELLIPSGI